MIRNGRPPLIAALVCFLIYFGNVAMGAAGLGVLLGDVAEMLTLFAAALLFVVGVLAREAAMASANGNTNDQSLKGGKA